MCFLSVLPQILHYCHLELSVTEREVHEECVAIRLQVMAALEQVGFCMNYGYILDYQFAFECPSHPGKEHLCVLEGAI